MLRGLMVTLQIGGLRIHIILKRNRVIQSYLCGKTLLSSGKHTQTYEKCEDKTYTRKSDHALTHVRWEEVEGDAFQNNKVFDLLHSGTESHHAV